MKKTFFAAILGIACIGAFAFKANQKVVTYYYDEAGTATPANFATEPCPGDGNQCFAPIPGRPDQTPQPLFVDIQLNTPAERN